MPLLRNASWFLFAYSIVRAATLVPNWHALSTNLAITLLLRLCKRAGIEWTCWQLSISPAVVL
jgi:hypothetical protein